MKGFFTNIEKGEGRCIIDGNEYEVRDGSAHHKDVIVRATKEEAEAGEAAIK